MASKGPRRTELEGDVQYIKTPKARPSAFEPGDDCGIPTSGVRFDDQILPSPLNSAEIIYSRLQYTMRLYQPMALETTVSPTFS